MTTRIRIYWKSGADNIAAWNAVCQRAIYRFGSSDRFTTFANVEYMEFIFKDNKDALMFALEHDGIFISDEQVARDTFASYF